MQTRVLAETMIKAEQLFIHLYSFTTHYLKNITIPVLLPTLKDMIKYPVTNLKRREPAQARYHSSAELSMGIQRLEEFKSLGGLSFVSLLDRRLVTGTLQATGNTEEESLPRFEQEIIFLRKEQNLQSSPLNYVFTHPVHPIAEERQVIRKIEQREVIEVVKKEVQTLMTPSSILANFSRTDYLQIADQVFSTLVRRLQVEKERLGLH
jgi:hypothetical protein